MKNIVFFFIILLSYSEIKGTFIHEHAFKSSVMGLETSHNFLSFQKLVYRNQLDYVDNERYFRLRMEYKKENGRRDDEFEVREIIGGVGNWRFGKKLVKIGDNNRYFNLHLHRPLADTGVIIDEETIGFGFISQKKNREITLFLGSDNDQNHSAYIVVKDEAAGFHYQVLGGFEYRSKRNGFASCHAGGEAGYEKGVLSINFLWANHWRQKGDNELNGWNYNEIAVLNSNVRMFGKTYYLFDLMISATHDGDYWKDYERGILSGLSYREDNYEISFLLEPVWKRIDDIRKKEFFNHIIYKYFFKKKIYLNCDLRLFHDDGEVRKGLILEGGLMF